MVTPGLEHSTAACDVGGEMRRGDKTEMLFKEYAVSRAVMCGGDVGRGGGGGGLQRHVTYH